MKELDERHVGELRDFRAQVATTVEDLQKECERHKQTIIESLVRATVDLRSRAYNSRCFPAISKRQRRPSFQSLAPRRCWHRRWRDMQQFATCAEYLYWRADWRYWVTLLHWFFLEGRGENKSFP